MTRHRATRLLVALLPPVLLLAPPSAGADEAKADCEPGQAWIGYGTTDPIRETWESIPPPIGLRNCEGEHWDGQDSVEPTRAPPTSPPCLEADVDQANGVVYVAYCLGSDPNDGSASLLGLHPTRHRLTVDIVIPWARRRGRGSDLRPEPPSPAR